LSVGNVLAFKIRTLKERLVILELHPQGRHRLIKKWKRDLAELEEELKNDKIH